MYVRIHFENNLKENIVFISTLRHLAHATSDLLKKFDVKINAAVEFLNGIIQWFFLDIYGFRGLSVRLILTLVKSSKRSKCSQIVQI